MYAERKGCFKTQSKLHIRSAVHFLSHVSFGGRKGTEQMFNTADWWGWKTESTRAVTLIARHCVLKPGVCSAEAAVGYFFSSDGYSGPGAVILLHVGCTDLSWDLSLGQIGGLQNLWRKPAPLLGWLFSASHLLLFLMCATHPEECTDSWEEMVQSAALLIWHMAGGLWWWG